MSSHAGNEHAPTPEPWDHRQQQAKPRLPECTAATGATDRPPPNLDLGRTAISGEDWRRLYGGRG